MADLYFTDYQGNAIGGSQSSPQSSDSKSVFNYFGVFIELEFEGANKLVGEVRVEGNSTYTFGNFNTNRGSTFDEYFEFFGDGINNNFVFVRSDDIVVAEITSVDGSTTSIIQKVDPKRVPSNSETPFKSKVEEELSLGRFVRKVNISEFNSNGVHQSGRSELNLDQVRFLKEIENSFNINDLTDTVSVGVDDDDDGNIDRTEDYRAARDFQTGPETPANEQELSMGRKVNKLKEWLNF